MVNRKLVAEMIGTFWLVFCGVGSALLAGKAVGVLGVSIAFGLSVVTMAYAIGHISGAHLNPAVSIGCFFAGRLPGKDLGGYIAAQVIGGCLAAATLALIANGNKGFELEAFRAVSNGFGEHSPSSYNMLSVAVIEAVMTFVFLLVILGATSKASSPGMAGLAIGLCLALIHIVSIPVSNTSVNPARSIATAAFGSGWALGQLWLFIVAPIVGAAAAGFVHKRLEE
jgi:aquaporin Z